MRGRDGAQVGRFELAELAGGQRADWLDVSAANWACPAR
jgi:hypothetical protein